MREVAEFGLQAAAAADEHRDHVTGVTADRSSPRRTVQRSRALHPGGRDSPTSSTVTARRSRQGECAAANAIIERTLLRALQLGRSALPDTTKASGRRRVRGGNVLSHAERRDRTTAGRIIPSRQIGMCVASLRIV